MIPPRPKDARPNPTLKSWFFLKIKSLMTASMNSDGTINEHPDSPILKSDSDTEDLQILDFDSVFSVEENIKKVNNSELCVSLPTEEGPKCPDCGFNSQHRTYCNH